MCECGGDPALTCCRPLSLDRCCGGLPTGSQQLLSRSQVPSPGAPQPKYGSRWAPRGCERPAQAHCELGHLEFGSTHRVKLFAAAGHHTQFDSRRKQQPHIRQQTWQAGMQEPSNSVGRSNPDFECAKLCQACPKRQIFINEFQLDPFSRRQ